MSQLGRHFIPNGTQRITVVSAVQVASNEVFLTYYLNAALTADIFVVDTPSDVTILLTANTGHDIQALVQSGGVDSTSQPIVVGTDDLNAQGY